MYTCYSSFLILPYRKKIKKAQYATALQITPIKMDAHSICKAVFDNTNKSKTIAHLMRLT
ncbi:hypothetical protein SpAn4DRAFT_1109 [Sporomusa ovata]|uniref:Uncharacterized protein n=1 Tax=Sporomusa ovata TaxID=2378 RepID=A0A0U1L4K4_9FIRM|nr:hypothetical protein SpAn4DRAFT_1109 [Sporomusa ovata]